MSEFSNSKKRLPASSDSEQDRPQTASPPLKLARMAKDVKSLSGIPVTEASYGKLAVYQIPLTEVMRNETMRIAKYNVKFEHPSGLLSGAVRYVKDLAANLKISAYRPEAQCTSKVLMVVGGKELGLQVPYIAPSATLSICTLSHTAKQTIILLHCKLRAQL